MRGKFGRLEQALDCSFFTGEHAAVLAMMLAVIDRDTTQIEALNARIEELTGPWLRQVAQLDGVHGIGPVCAQDIIADTGADMTAFPIARQRWRAPGAAACPAEDLFSDQDAPGLPVLLERQPEAGRHAPPRPAGPGEPGPVAP